MELFRIFHLDPKLQQMEEIWDLDRHGKHWQQIKPMTLSAQAWSAKPAETRRVASQLR